MAWVSKSGYIRGCRLRPSYFFCIALVSSTKKSRRSELFLATYRSTETNISVIIWGREIYVVVGWWSSCLPSRKLSPIPASMYLNHPQCISTKLNVAQCSPTSLNGSLCWSTCQQGPRAGTSASLLDIRWNQDDRPFDSMQLLRLLNYREAKQDLHQESIKNS